ncbi:glycosyltransferase family 2 protein [Roseovarius sp. THAF9]|uniref:glycosyltransferase family 2 protein n=1 Tax=Roseovarius sp. THAF9 TaxID=2587847 RepID=UPI001267F905|nr:glycosyltransferase family 2 protein [Roseovarius sp. THAF9]
MLISIVIPTRDRAQYLRHSLATATAIIDTNIEILVSDNASVDETQKVVSEAQDPRVRYVNTGARLSMRQNFEFALHQSTGDYVIYFGDDDGIIPGQFPFLRKILEVHRPDALSWDFPVYGWPVDGYGSRVGGVRLVRSKLFGKPALMDATDRLHALERGRLDLFHPLPQLYHGCMSRDYLGRIARQDGVCMLARSPDLFVSFRSTQLGGRFLHCNHAFSINGHSPASNGGSFSAQGTKNAQSMEQSKFKSETRLDTVDDVMPISKSTALEFLSTLETVKHHFPEVPISLDYRSWYVTVLVEAIKKDPETSESIMSSLEQHARILGCEKALEKAKSQWLWYARKLSVTWAKNRSKLSSFRINTQFGQQNTIYTAAQCCDQLLVEDLGMVIEDKLPRSQAWKKFLGRKKARAQ